MKKLLTVLLVLAVLVPVFASSSNWSAGAEINTGKAVNAAVEYSFDENWKAGVKLNLKAAFSKTLSLGIKAQYKVYDLDLDSAVLPISVGAQVDISGKNFEPKALANISYDFDDFTVYSDVYASYNTVAGKLPIEFGASLGLLYRF